MNKDLNVSSLNMNKQRHTKKTLAIGTFICLSATAMAAIASPENDYKLNAEMLIASNMQIPSHSYQSQDIQSLKEQLLEKTKELQEYKACLFRASHPQDQAKITELTRQIADLEKNKQELIAKVTLCKEELADAKKQKDSLEVSSEALTDYIKKQRILVEEEKQALTAKILAYMEEAENQKLYNETLTEELAALKDRATSYEKLLAYHESNEDLQDALLDASMLKFELDDARVQAAEKEQELIVSSINYLTMAHDHIEKLNSKQSELQAKLEESKKQYSMLVASMDSLRSDKSSLQIEHDRLTAKIGSDEDTFKKYTAQRHMFANKMMENEETLNAALLYYEGTLGDLTKQVQSLQTLLTKEEATKVDLINENEYIALYYDLEKQNLQDAVSDNNETMSNALTAYQLAINDYLQQLQTIEDRFAAEEDKRLKLENEKEILFDQERERLETVIAERSNAFASAEQTYQTTISEHTIELQKLQELLSQELDESKRLSDERNQLMADIDSHAKKIEELKEELVAAEASHLSLKQAHDELASKNSDAEDQLLQYEDDLASSQASIAEHTHQIEELKEQLAAAEANHLSLQQAHDELASKNSEAEDQLSQYEDDLTSSQVSIADNTHQIEELKEQLAAAEASLLTIKQAHDELASKNSKAEEQLSQYEDDLASSQASIGENIKEIEELKELLAAAEKANHDLQQSHDDLASKYSGDESQLSQYEEDLASSQASIAEKTQLIEELKEQLVAAEKVNLSIKQEQEELASKNFGAEDLLSQYEDDLAYTQAAIADNTKQIEELKEQLAGAEKVNLTLKQEHDDLASKHSDAEHQISQYENDFAENIKQIEELKEHLAAAEKAYLLLQQTHDDLASKNSSAENQLSQYEEDLAYSQASITDNTKQIEELKEQLAAAEQANLALKQAHDDLFVKNSNAEHQLSQYEDDLTYSQASITENSKQIEELEGQLTAAEKANLALKQAHDDLFVKNSNAEHQLSQYEETFVENTQQIQELKEQLATAEKAKLFLKKAHDDLAAKNSGSEHQLSEYEDDLATSQAAIAESIHQIEELKQHLAAAERENLSLKQAHDDLASKNSGNEHKLSEYENDLASSQASIAESIHQIEELKQHVAAAERENLSLKQAHDELAAKNSGAEHQLLKYEDDLTHSQVSISENIRHIEELEGRLATAETNALSLKQAYEDSIANKEQQFLLSQESLAAHKDHLAELVFKLEQKEREYEAADHQLQILQTVKVELHETINYAERQLSNAQQESARKDQEWNQYHQESIQAMNQLKNQIHDQLVTISHLNQEIVDHYANQIEKDLKEKELEHNIKSLATVAERQDHALAEANSAFSMVQEYNQHLQAENMELKNRLSNMEIAERSHKMKSSSDESQETQLISPALLNLLKPR